MYTVANSYVICSVQKWGIKIRDDQHRYQGSFFLKTDVFEMTYWAYVTTAECSNVGLLILNGYVLSISLLE